MIEMIKTIVLFIIFFFGFVVSHPYKVVSEGEADEILAGLIRFGDPDNPWPTTRQSIKTEICANYNQDIFKVVNFVLHKYEEDNIQILFRLYANEVTRLLHILCMDDENIKHTISKLTLYNYKTEEMKIHRNKLKAALQYASDRQNKVTLSQIVCYIDVSFNNIINELPASQAKETATKVFQGMKRAVFGYVKNLIRKQVKNETCDLTPFPPKGFVPKYKSIGFHLLNAFANIISEMDTDSHIANPNKSTLPTTVPQTTTSATTITGTTAVPQTTSTPTTSATITTTAPTTPTPTTVAPTTAAPITTPAPTTLVPTTAAPTTTPVPTTLAPTTAATTTTPAPTTTVPTTVAPTTTPTPTTAAPTTAAPTTAAPTTTPAPTTVAPTTVAPTTTPVPTTAAVTTAAPTTAAPTTAATTTVAPTVTTTQTTTPKK